MKKALVVIILLLAVFLGEMLLFENNTHTQNDKPYIAVSSFPLYEIVNKVTAGSIDVVKLVPFGVEPHTYTPSVKTMQYLNGATRFFYNGLGMEPWINKPYKNGVDMSKSVHLIDMCEAEEEHAHHHEEDSDPHYWLSIENMARMTETVVSELIQVFPDKAEMYTENSHKYIRELRALQDEFNEGLMGCKRKEIVVNHNAFAYLSDTYGFESHALMGLSPDEQASAKRMKEISDLVKEEGITTIFFESFVSDKVAQTISRETGVKAVSLQPLANVTQEESTQGYVPLMQANLLKLRAAMECE